MLRTTDVAKLPFFTAEDAKDAEKLEFLSVLSALRGYF
jgi:hypothetical protein